MERIKISYGWISKMVNFNYLMENKYISRIFPLNDNHTLFGVKNMTYIDGLIHEDPNVFLN